MENISADKRQRLKQELAKSLAEWPDLDAVPQDMVVAGINSAIERADIREPIMAEDLLAIVTEIMLPDHHQNLQPQVLLHDMMAEKDAETGLTREMRAALLRGQRVIDRIGTNTTSDARVRRQHYVPRFYLRSFAQRHKGNKYRLHEYSLTTFQLRRTTVEDTGLESNYYDISDAEGNFTSIDFWLKQLEDEAAPLLKRLLATQAVDGLSDEDRYLLALFFVTLSTRVPAMRNLYQRMYEPIREQIKMLEARFERYDDQLDRHLRPDAKEVAQMANGVTQEMAIGMANLVFVRDWALFATGEEHPLVTSDNPIVRENPLPNGLLGLASPGVQFALPLSPNLLLFIYNRRDFPVVFRTDRPIPLSLEQVRYYNFLQVEQAARFLISRDNECDTVFHQWKEETAVFTLTWNRLIRREPRLELLRQEVLRQRDDGTSPYVCANELWLGDDRGTGFLRRLEGLAGSASASDDHIVRSEEAYALAEKILYESLPYCRNCNCASDEPPLT